MVELLQDRIQDILNFDKELTELNNLKLYVSDLYRLVFLKKTLHVNQPDENKKEDEENENDEEVPIYYYTDLQFILFDSLSAQLKDFSTMAREKNYQEIEIVLRQSERDFFHLYLTPLHMPDKKIQSLIRKRNEISFNKRFHELIERSMVFYITQGNSNLNVRLVLDKLITYLENYGFRPSYYLRLSLLRRISAKEKILTEFLMQISENPAFNIPFSKLDLNEERITSRKAVKMLLDHMLANANYRSEVKLSETIDILLGYFELTTRELNNTISAIVSDFFHNIDIFMNALKISACWSHFVETHEPKLDQLQFGSTTLYLEMDKAKPSSTTYEGSLETGYLHEIGPAGFSTSMTFFYQRCVVIGKWDDDCFENDLSVDCKDFPKKLAVIFCGFNGYYIIDISSSGFLRRKVQNNEEAEIELNQVIQLGSNMLVKVESIDTEVVKGIDGQPNQKFHVAKLLIIRLEGEKGPQAAVGTYLFPKMVNNGPGDFIGRYVPNDKCVINEERAPTISGRHAEFKCKNKKIFIKDAGSKNGVFILYKKYSELVDSKPSYPMKIENNTLVYSQGAQFRFTIK